MNTCRQQMTGSSRMLEVLLVVLLSGMLTRVPSAQTAVFACAAGDVACLIAAIHAANATGEADTITLAAGIYSLTAVDNDIDGPNGLPSMTSPLAPGAPLAVMPCSRWMPPPGP
jgi:hypothetical protein